MNFLLPKTPGQIQYLDALTGSKPIIIATGPAGTGKTMFACQQASEYLYNSRCSKIILTRPIVSVDEELGFLPGGLEKKMDPWTRPMFDIMSRYFTKNQIKQMTREKILEISPLAYMRGRTFDDAFVIADEMQNSTPNQMKMLLTRIGDDSRMVVTGDLEQCDLREDQPSGLSDLVFKMGCDIYDYIEHVELDSSDIQRSEAVKEVISIYENGN